MTASQQTPATGWGRFKQIGPGVVVATTGVGVGDLATSMVVGAETGTTLLWAVIVGAALKFAMAEGVGRWHLSTESTMLRGWRELGTWTLIYFGVYIAIWGLSYGAAVMSATALPLRALFPAVPFDVFAIASGIIGLLLVLFGRYWFLERLIMVFVGLMFVTVVGTALLAVPNMAEVVQGLVPRMRDGELVYVLGLIGGVGGTITVAAYGLWMREKGWRSREWLSVMRIDATTAYVLTGIFMIAMLIVGANMLYAAGLDIEGQDGLMAFGGQLEQRFGEWARVLFLVGFWATSFSSLLGVWNGVSLFFVDFVHTLRERKEGASGKGMEERDDERSPYFRAYALWLTFPPMLLLLWGEPAQLVLAYAVLGAFFMPFLAGTLLVMLNSKSKVPDGFRSGWLSNGALGAGVVLFVFLLIQELVGLFSS